MYGLRCVVMVSFFMAAYCDIVYIGNSTLKFFIGDDYIYNTLKLATPFVTPKGTRQNWYKRPQASNAVSGLSFSLIGI